METIEEGEGGVVDAVGVNDGDIELLYEDCEKLFKKLQSDAARIVFDFYKLRSRLTLLQDLYYTRDARVSESSGKVQEVGRGQNRLGEHPRLAKPQQSLLDRPSRPTEAQGRSTAPKAKKEK